MPLVPSHEKVLEVLEDGSWKYPEEISGESALALRTVRWALKHLVDKGLLSQKLNIHDMRRVSYQIKPGIPQK